MLDSVLLSAVNTDDWPALGRSFSVILGEDLAGLPEKKDKRMLARRLRARLNIDLPAGRERDVVNNWLSGQLPKTARGPFSRREVLAGIQAIMEVWSGGRGARDYVALFLQPGNAS